MKISVTLVGSSFLVLYMRPSTHRWKDSKCYWRTYYNCFVKWIKFQILILIHVDKCISCPSPEIPYFRIDRGKSQRPKSSVCAQNMSILSAKTKIGYLYIPFLITHGEKCRSRRLKGTAMKLHFGNEMAIVLMNTHQIQLHI